MPDWIAARMPESRTSPRRSTGAETTLERMQLTACPWGRVRTREAKSKQRWTDFRHAEGVPTETVCQQAGIVVTDDPALLAPMNHRYDLTVWTLGRGRLSAPFLLDYDTGTEQLGVLTARLIGYAESSPPSAVPWLELFWVHLAARERNIQQRPTGLPASDTVATRARDDATARRSGLLARMCRWAPRW